MAVVSLRNVAKVYPGDVRAVDSFNLETSDGELIVLVGPSGCGKSTILRSIAGLEEITSGDILLDGKSVVGTSPKDRDLAMVFQSYALYPHMTVYENLAFGLKMRKTPKPEIDARVEEAARLLGLSALLQRKPKALSGGQRQRVAVGRAIVRKPKCFLFDEPLSNVDAKVRAEMRAEIKRLQMRLAVTSIYVTHDQEEAMTLGDRVVVMSDGIIQQIGPPLEIYHQPANRFVASFLGTPQMNFLNGTLRGENGTLWFESGANRLALPEWVRSGSVKEGANVIAGIRPQALRLMPTTSSAPFTADAEWIEPLGDRMDIHLVTPEGGRLVARVDSETGLKPAEVRGLFVDVTQIQLFADDGAGKNLRHESSGATAWQ